MPKCSFRYCKNISSVKLKKDGISYFSFPRNPIRCAQWISVVTQQRREDFFKPNSWSVVCSKHFCKEDMYMTPKGITRLHKTAVPREVVQTPDDHKIEIEIPAIGGDTEIQTPGDLIIKIEKLENGVDTEVQIPGDLNIKIEKPDSDGENEVQTRDDIKIKIEKLDNHIDTKVETPDDLKTKVRKPNDGGDNEVSASSTLNNLENKKKIETPTSQSIDSIVDSLQIVQLKSELYKCHIRLNKKLTIIDNLRKKNSRLIKRNSLLKSALKDLKKRLKK